MSILRCLLALVLVALVAVQLSPTAATAPPSSAPPAAELLRQTPLLFIENVGQFDPAVRYQARGSGGVWWFTDDAIWLSLAGATSSDGVTAWTRLRVQFAGARAASPQPTAPLETRVSYLLGSDPAGWHTGVSTWRGLRYTDLYPGLDLVIAGAGAGQLRWQWEARDGANAASARLTIEGGDLRAVEQGQLRIATQQTEVLLPLPAAAGTTAPAALVGNEVVGPVGVGGASTGELQAAAVNDLLYGTYLGGTGDDQATGVAVDAGGSAYVVGRTSSATFSSLPASFDPVLSENSTGQDAFIAKVDPTGSTLTYWTYLGGSSLDAASGVAVNGLGQAYVTGTTTSNALNGGFPTSDNAYQKPPQPGNDNVFVTVLDVAGDSLIYSTLLAGSGLDQAGNIAVGADNQAYVAGTSFSGDFPAKGGISKPGNSDVFLAKLNPASTSGPTSLVYSTFVGSSQKERNGFVAVDAGGNAYVAGVVENHSAFNNVTRPLGQPGPFDKTYNGGFTDAFVAKFSPTGALTYASLLGGSDEDAATGIAVDSAGTNVYVTGYTNSTTGLAVPFPKAAGTFGGGLCAINPTTNRTCFDAFVVKMTLAATGNSDLIASAIMGGSGDDIGNGVAFDSLGRVYVTGETGSSNFPVTTTTAFQNSAQGGRDAFGVKLDAAFSSLLYSTYLGGSSDDFGRGVAVGGTTPYIVGGTFSTNFPTRSGGYQLTSGGGAAGFVTKWAMPETNPLPLAPPPSTPTPTPTLVPGQPTATPPPTPTQPSGGVPTPTPQPTQPVPSTIAKTWYFAEGYTGNGFDEYLTINNPGAAAGTATISYFVEGETTPRQRVVTLAAASRTTVVVHGDPSPNNPGGLGRLSVGHATRVVSTVPVIVERPMYFSYGPVVNGGHNVLGANAQSKTWYFAEGYTGTGFDEFLTILNAGGAGTATITYFIEGEPSQTKNVSLPANSRTTIAVHDGGVPGGLGRGKSHATRVQTSVDTVVERPMYFIYGPGYDGGHDVVGATSPGKTWYFAEGYTGQGFDEFLTINNPGGTAGTATITYFIEGQASQTKNVNLPPNSRTTVIVHEATSASNPGGLGRLSNGHATRVQTSVDTVVERPMYFTYGPGYDGGHDVLGAATPRQDWYFAEGYTGNGFDEYLTINNPNASAGTATIFYFLEGLAPANRVIPLAPNSRTTVPVHNAFDPTGNPGGLGRVQVGHSTRIVSSVPVIIERPMYFTYGPGYDGGHNVMGYAP